MGQLINFKDFSLPDAAKYNAAVEHHVNNTAFKLHSVTQVARILGIGKDNIYKFLESGQLGYIQIGKRKKIPVQEIHNFIQRNTRRGTEMKARITTVSMDADKFLSNKKTTKIKSLEGDKILEKIIRNN